MKLGLIAIMSLCLVFVVACERRAPDTTQAAGEAERSIIAERDHYVDSTEAKLEAVGKRIDSLQEHATDMTGMDKSNFDSQISSLRSQHETVQQKLDNIGEIDDSSWSNLKSDVDSSVSKLEQSVQKLESQMPRMGR